MRAPEPAPKSPSPRDWMKRQSRWSIYELIVWAAAITPFFLFPTYLPLANQIAIAALFALSVDLILGYAGIVTLGHAMFFGLGAYFAGIISVYGWGEPITGLLMAGAFAGLVGFVASFLITRVQHLALIMVTLGLGYLTLELANAMSWLTGNRWGARHEPLADFDTFRFDLWGYTAIPSMIVLYLLPAQPASRQFLLRYPARVRENIKRMPAWF